MATTNGTHWTLTQAISLPLMGIGNLEFLDNATKGMGLNSLPLMGIGNRPHGPVDSGPGSETHYPSWGLATLAEPGDGEQGLMVLITPHGDWQHQWAAVR